MLTEWPQNLKPSPESLPTYLPNQWHSGCFDVSGQNVQSCLFGSRTAMRHAAILGDSIAGARLPGLREGLGKLGWSVQTLTMGQCPNITATTLVDGQPFIDCQNHRQWALGYLAKVKPDLVVLSNSYTEVLAGGNTDKAKIWQARPPGCREANSQDGRRCRDSWESAWITQPAVVRYGIQWPGGLHRDAISDLS